MSTIERRQADSGISKARLCLAMLLSWGAFLLLFVLGEGIGIPESVPRARYLNTAKLGGGMAAYFVGAQFFLSRGHTQAVRRDWPLMLGLNISFILLGVLILKEGPALKALGWLVVVAATVGGSCAGAAWAARLARQRQSLPVRAEG
ncbi:MAG: hypothetical protein FJY95_02755 [Candidatus Handelsmanbacteria bacterium]|nr:hypothetical protein [Candidatus Handelsmanbacteria bacterium]